MSVLAALCSSFVYPCYSIIVHCNGILCTVFHSCGTVLHSDWSVLHDALGNSNSSMGHNTPQCQLFITVTIYHHCICPIIAPCTPLFSTVCTVLSVQGGYVVVLLDIILPMGCHYHISISEIIIFYNSAPI